MDLKITGVVKYGGKWLRPGDVVKKVDDEVGNDLIAKDVAELHDSKDSGPSADLHELRERAKELDIPKAGQLGEVKLREAIAEKEAELQQQEAAKQLTEMRVKAKELGIEGADDLDAEALAAAITTAEQK